MNSRHTGYGYLTLGAILLAGSLYTGGGSRVDARSLPPGGTSRMALLPASLLLADPLPEDSTDRSLLPAEQVYKNIQTLKGISAGELMGTMTFMSASLGVRCGYCHVQQDFSLDDKPAKKTARSMIRMTGDINTKNFSALTVTCYTCHRGNSMPADVPPVAQGTGGALNLGDALAVKRDSLQTVDAVLDRYVEVLGGEKALANISTRVLRASEVQSGGTTATVDISQKAPNIFRGTTVSSDQKRGSVVEVYDGRASWVLFGNRPPGSAGNVDLEQLLREAEFFPAVDLRRNFSAVRLLGREHVGDRDYYVVLASHDKSSDRLYFDAGTGLLARRYVEYHTVLGALPFSIEYGDYRDVDGVKIPYTVKWSTLRESWTDTITQLRHNVALADSVFAKPK